METQSQSPKKIDVQYDEGSNTKSQTQLGFDVWNKRYATATSNQTTLFENWRKYYDSFYARSEETAVAKWRSQVFLPIITGKIRDIQARCVSGRPQWTVTPREINNFSTTEEAFEQIKQLRIKADKVKAKMDFDYDNPEMDVAMQSKLGDSVLDAGIVGQGVARVPYIIKQNTFREREDLTGNDGAFEGQVDMTQHTETDVTVGHNDYIPISPFNFFISPKATSLQGSPWLIVHDYVTLDEIKRDNPEYQNLEQIPEDARATDDMQTYNAARNRALVGDQISIDTTIPVLERFECWDKANNTCQVFLRYSGNNVEVYNQPNHYWHQMYPFAEIYLLRRPGQFFGESIYDTTLSLQSGVNDILNHYIDQLNMTDGMMAFEKTSIVEPYRIEPGGEVRYDGTAPTPLKWPAPDPNQLQTIMNIANAAVETATISQYASGVPNSATDTTAGTATGVTRLMEAANAKIGMMMSNVRQGWKTVGNIWLSNTQQYMDRPQLVDTVSQGTKQTDIVTPADVQGRWLLRVDDGSFEPVSDEQKRKEALDFAANLKTYQEASVAQAERLGDPTQALNINWANVAGQMAYLYNKDPSDIILDNSTIAQPMQAGMQAGDVGTTTDENAVLQPPTAETTTQPSQPSQATPNMSIQPDGKSMPDSFPIRDLTSPSVAAMLQ